MKNLFSLFTLLIGAGILFTGFIIDTSDKHKLQLRAISPLDLSVLNKNSDANIEPDNPESSDWYKEACQILRNLNTMFHSVKV